VKWLKDELKFDHVINYKTTNFSKALKEISPEGVDIYFDNVGGDFYTTMVSNHMKPEGRVLICGAMAAFDSTGPMKSKLYRIIIIIGVKISY
jgi:NADPH-dependent curcumin reductase CurA